MSLESLEYCSIAKLRMELILQVGQYGRNGQVDSRSYTRRLINLNMAFHLTFLPFVFTS
jgi:hypothetical protein